MPLARLALWLSPLFRPDLANFRLIQALITAGAVGRSPYPVAASNCRSGSAKKRRATALAPGHRARCRD